MVDKKKILQYIQIMKHKKQVILITGASSGIGLATANYLADKGYTVYGTARRQFDAEKFSFLQADVCSHQDMKNVFDTILEKEGHIDIVINNAGMGISGAIEHTEKQNISTIFETNIVALVDVCALAIPYLRQNGGGKIINVSSVAAPIAIPFQACYSATKSAIETFSFALSNEVKPFKIKVCCVRPGDTKTGFTSARVKNSIEKDENYGDRISKSVKKMEKDEQKGMSAVKVSKLIHSAIKRKHPPLVCTVGFGYKILCVLAKLLPARFVNFIVRKIYG